MEVHLLEAKINQVRIEPSDSAQVVYDHYEKFLFDDFGITEDQYEISFNYYLDHPNEFVKVYTEAVDSLLQKEKTGK